MKIYLLFILIMAVIFYEGCSNNPVTVTPGSYPSPLTSTHDSKYAAQWMDLLYNAVSNQDINPPKASRIYCYASITLYESVKYGMPNYASLSGQLTGMPSMPGISTTAVYDWPSVIAGSMPVITRSLLDTVISLTDQDITNMTNNQIAERRAVVSSDIVDRSVAYGQSVANAITSWCHLDNYTQTRTMVYVVPPRTINPAYWEPTDPAHLKPLEPFWGLIRCFAMPNSQSCIVPMNKLFDTIPGTPFYNDAIEVKNTVDNLTSDQQNIALYWQDKLRTGTPAGHWVSIATQIVGLKHMKLDETVEMYVLECIAMADAFISCWEAKYIYNLLRPYTYIRQYTGNPNWQTFLPTPAFPEYTSGHSTQSAAAAYILTNLLGTVSFSDTTLVSQGFIARSFTSFNQARDEAAISRLYGGIHYRQAIENGVAQGTLVGQTVLNRIRLKIF